MNTKTLKEINSDSPIIKTIRKAGLSLAVIFSREEIERFNLKYLDKIDLSNAIPICNAEIIKSTKQDKKA